MRGDVRARTVRDLAGDADLDVEETLIRLWDAGLDDLIEPGQLVPRKEMTTARAALGLTAGSTNSISKLAKEFGQSDQELRNLLELLGFKILSNSRKAPKGARSRLARYFATPVEENAPTSQSEQVDFHWQPIGTRPKGAMRYLSEDEVEKIHEYLVDMFSSGPDPISPVGVRDKNLLGSAVMRPQTAIGGQFKYTTVETASAALLHGLALNHPFYNGNKRTALVAALVMLRENDLLCEASEQELVKLLVRVASHRLVDMDKGLRADREVMAISEWLTSRVRVLSRNEHILKFHELRKILVRFNCKLWHPRGKGNRINIERTVPDARWYRRDKTRIIRTQIYYKNEGVDVETNTIRKIREDLGLTESDGCDDSAFFDGRSLLDEVVIQYQNVLRILAKI